MSLPPSILDPDAHDVLRTVAAQFGDRAALVTSLGPQTLCLLQMLHEDGLKLPTFFLDTGEPFPETLDFRRVVEAHFGIEITAVRPGPVPAGLHHADPERCCHLRKVEPLAGLLSGFDAWVSGIRREQTGDRADAGAVEWDARFGLWKFNPLAAWSRAEVDAFLIERSLPRHPLWERGYKSVGCAPCTRPVATGDDERAGRWAGLAKTECGLHRRGAAPAAARALATASPPASSPSSHPKATA